MLWRDALHAGKEIEWFHMRECIKLEGQFASFNRYQADRKMNTLIDVLVPFLKAKRVREFTAILDWDIYDRAVTGPVKSAFYDPYLFLIGALQAEVAKFVAGSKNAAPVYFFFDDQNVHLERDSANLFYRARVSRPRKIESVN
jgi:hypothetical protein